MANSKFPDTVQGSIEMQQHNGDDPESRKSRDTKDNELLTQRTGERPILKRQFGFMSILGFSCLVLSTWQGAFVLLGIGLENGGPAGLIYSFIIVWIGNLATFATLAELVSMAPTAGGQYHWVSILAPRSCQKVLSYITGWLTVAGWQANVASSSYVCGTLIQGFIEVVDSQYSPKLWHATLLLYGSVALAVLATTVAGTPLPKIESCLLVIYIFGFFGVLVPLVYLGPHSDASFVFTTFINNGGWDSQTLSFFVGISGNAFAFLGADSVYHMSEEIHNAAMVVPQFIVWSIVLNGVVGLSMYFAILFNLGDLQAAIDSPYIYPFIEVLLQAIRSQAGTAVILAILIIVDLSLVIGVVAASSRMLWSFAWDRGIPGWRRVSQVNRSSSIPMIAIFTTTLVSLLLGLISIGSPVAFNDVISPAVSTLYASYFVACVLLLWRRLKGEKAGVGSWKMPEPLGKVTNAFACVYLLIVFFFTFCPPATPVTPDTMNYSSLVMGFVTAVSGLYYVLRARKTYTGPVVDTHVRG